MEKRMLSIQTFNVFYQDITLIPLFAFVCFIPLLQKTSSEAIKEKETKNRSTLLTPEICFPTNNTKFDGRFRIGDIALSDRQKERFLRMHRRKRKFVTQDTFVWKMPIHYTLDSAFDAWQTREIHRAIRYWESKTCIRFHRLMTISPDYPATNILHIVKQDGCWSYVGFKKRNQELSLADDCFEFGILLHEIGHALGFWHEHARPDRDDHVNIHLENVDTEDNIRNFDKALWGDLTTLTVPYNLGSIMHYGPYTYNKDQLPTITTKDFHMQHVIGQRKALSFHDVKQANLAYCSDTCDMFSLSCQNDGYADPLTLCKTCRCESAFSGRFCEKPAQPSGRVCGGVVGASNSSQVLESPNFWKIQMAGQKCSWILTSEEGSVIYLSIHNRPFFLQCSHGNRCRDYVEIRYKQNLALSGPRYCNCISPGPVIRSASNKAAVYFKSQYGGVGGFRLTFYSDSCGGCASSKRESQPPCNRYRRVPCLRRWKRRIKRKCYGWWLWHPSFCGYRYEMASRPDTCIKTSKFCCKNFDHHGNQCKKKTTASLVTKNTSISPETFTDHLSSWTLWSNCTQACGGCGVQERYRICKSIPNRQVTRERRRCNTMPCLIEILHNCSKTVSGKFLCNPWYTRARYCIRYKKQPDVCRSKCCAGYAIKNGECVETFS